MTTRILKIFFVLAIVGAGIGLNMLLSSFKKDPEKRPSSDNALLVAQVPIMQSDENVTVVAMGTVMPSKSVTIFPEVTGRIISQNKQLVPGGHFSKGEQILKIDPRDYDLTLKQQKATVERAKMDLATEKARKSVAEKEWALISEEVRPTAEGKKLALREIQLQTAQAVLESAKSGLQKARLARSRTIIKAPFSGIIANEFVDKGQIVSPATKIATLVGKDVYWVRVSVPVDRLPWIPIPGINDVQIGATARVIQTLSEGVSTYREGRVIKLLSDLDIKGKMAQLLIEVEDPMNSNTTTEGELPLLIGAYVNVEINGPLLEGVLEIPRRALRDSDTVWVNRNNKLAVEKVEIVWTVGDRIFVRGNVNAMENVVTSRIETPVKGLMLKTEDQAQAVPSSTVQDGASPQ